MILEGKTIVVSGVGTGLGSEVLRIAVRDGANVMAAARTQATLEAAAKEVDPSGERVAICPTDITDAAQCDALARATVDRFGGIDALVQVAARDAVFGGLADVSEEDWYNTIGVNVHGSTQVVKAVVPALRQRGGGSIVLIGSQSSMLPLIPQIAYAASKGALITAMKFMAKELGPDNIRVNHVVPTWMWGPPLEWYVTDQAKQRGITVEEAVREITDNMCLNEIPKDDDVAEAVAFFCSDRSRMITGQTLLVNAGELMP
jgi:NAD(P)-dependent dehydrogenase (short-subunit alcohol dehydrogenase family)